VLELFIFFGDGVQAYIRDADSFSSWYASLRNSIKSGTHFHDTTSTPVTMDQPTTAGSPFIEEMRGALRDLKKNLVYDDSRETVIPVCDGDKCKQYWIRNDLGSHSKSSEMGLLDRPYIISNDGLQ